MKKKISAICLSIVLSLSIVTILSSCSSKTQPVNAEITDIETSVSSDSEIVTVKESPDKYTWYIKNYVGKNCASFGYTSIGGNRFDEYGKATVKLIYTTTDGTYIDASSNDILKEYYITAQSIPANSELKLTFKKDSEGIEYDNRIETQSYEEIVLKVQKVGNSKKDTTKLIEIKPSPDKYHWYVANYVGRNLANCGYTSLSGELREEYGESDIKFIIVSSDGAFVDPEDTEALKNYVVTGQSIAPNTEIRLTFYKDSNGVEHDYLIESQNIEEIELTVKPLAASN